MRQNQILAFTIGAIVGTIGGLLLAPSSGRSTIESLISKLKKQTPNDELSNRNLYNLSELTEDVKGLEQLKAQLDA